MNFILQADVMLEGQFLFQEKILLARTCSCHLESFHCQMTCFKLHQVWSDSHFSHRILDVTESVAIAVFSNAFDSLTLILAALSLSVIML